MNDEDRRPRDAAYWADLVSHLEVGDAPGGDPSAVEGRRITGPLKGFGKLWDKTYRIRLQDHGIKPEEVIATWKDHYSELWPETASFYAPLSGVEPGEVALISDRQPGGLTLSTGVFVLYADEVSFSFVTPEGHPFAGMITFSSHRDDEGVTIAQVKALIRAQNPLVEATMAIYTHRREDRIWNHVLGSLASRLGLEDVEVEKEVVCVDDKRQWRYFSNIRHDGMLYALTKPFRRNRKS